MFFAKQIEENNVAEMTELNSYTKWQSISITDDFTEKITTYEMVYPTVDSIAVKNVILMKHNGTYMLLSTNSYDFEYNRAIDIKTANGVKSIEAKDLGPKHYLTPQNKNIYFPICLELPKNLVPSNGEMKIRTKGIVYTFNLNK